MDAVGRDTTRAKDRPKWYLMLPRDLDSAERTQAKSRILGRSRASESQRVDTG